MLWADPESCEDSFTATKEGTVYTSSVTLDEAGDWTLVVFVHVGFTPHTTTPNHITVQ